MMQPNDLPLLCLPTDMSDEAVAKLVEFLYELTEGLERHYFSQLHRYYHRNDCSEPETDLDLAPTSDPPF
jgi:hypothetical protein